MVHLRPSQLSEKWPCSLAASCRGAAQAADTSGVEYSLYQSQVDLSGAVSTALRKCQLGAGFGAVGFLGVAASMASSASPSAMVLVLAGAVANGYSQLAHKPTLLKSLALRHVEELVLVQPEIAKIGASAGPTLALEETTAAGNQEVVAASSPSASPEKPAAAASSQDSAAAAALPKDPEEWDDEDDEEDAADTAADGLGEFAWIKYTPELQLKVRCANAERQVTLTNPAAPWEGARFTGLVADDRVTIGDLCRLSRFLHIDAKDGESKHRDMLMVLLRSGKVIKEELMEPRTDVVQALQLSLSETTKIEGAKLSEVKPDDIKRMSRMPERESLIVQINGVGQRALASGVAILLASVLFTQRPNAQDPEKDLRLRYLFFDKPQ